MSQPPRPYRNPSRVPPRRPSAPNNRAYSTSLRRRNSGCGLLLVAVFAVLSVGGVYAYSRISSTLSNISSGEDVRPAVAQQGPPPALLQAPFNVLVLGVDLRADDPTEGARSDTLIVVHVDPVQKFASMLSIPRDTLAEIPNEVCGGAQKINAAYSCGYRNPDIYGPGATPDDAGQALAAQTVEQYLGIKINYTAQVDFNGFQKIVDALGGITVDVPKAILDPEYPTEDYGYMRLYIPAGLQRMDGTTALRYARTRHADNDFGRAQRQQQVLQAVLDELKQQGVLSQIEAVPQLLSVAEESVRTTMPLDLGSIRGLATLAQEIEPGRIQRLVIKPDQLEDGSSCLLSDLSSAIQWNPECVERLVQQMQTPPPLPQQDQNAPTVVQVQNGTRIRGLAGQVTVDLDVQGFTMTDAADAPDKDMPNTMILDYTGRSATVQELAQFLNVAPENIVDASAEQGPPSVDIVVRLGNDYQPPVGPQGNAQP